VVKGIEKDKIAPLVIASFDIECTSSHGDFPVAKKDYKKTAYELLQSFNEGKITEMNIVNEILGCMTGESTILSRVYPKQDQPINTAFIKGRLLKLREEFINILKGKVVFRKDQYTSVPKASKDEIMKTLTRRLGTWEGTQFTGFMPYLEGDPIIQIGTTVHKYGERECSYKNIVTLGSCDDIEGAEVISCETEQELLLKWSEVITKIDPDIVTGYNIFGFDMSYMYDRAMELGIAEEFCKIGKIRDHSCNYVEKTLSSSALGDNLLKYIDMDGRVLIDIMKVVQRDHKLDSYKLDAVASHFMKMNKNDVSPNDIFRLQKGSAGDRRTIAEYCIQDCALCNKLMMKLEILANNIGMSNVCNVPLSFIFMRGQGVKIFSLVAKQCREDDFMIPTIRKSYDDEDPEDEEGYEGAIVLPPKQGIYLEDPVSVLDYASLYPSSMISENLSHDCIVLDSRYDNLPGVEYLDISYDVYEVVDDKKVKVGEKICRFVQLPNGEKGVIPRILMKLLKARKDTRKKMEYQSVITKDGRSVAGLLSETEDVYTLKRVDGTSDTVSKADVISVKDTYDEFEKAVLDGLQVAYKVTANSLYGQVGARTSPIYLKDIAACTTATGRKMILQAKKFLEDHYMAEIVYGDSVTGYTPTYVRVNNIIHITRIEDIPKRFGDSNLDWVTMHNSDKECFELYGVDVWTEKGWTHVDRIIRHKLASHKKIFRILTHSGVVDCTDDHSLLRSNGDMVSSKSLNIGEEILHHHLPYQEVTTSINQFSVDEARIMGMFMGDGSCGMYNTKSGKKYTWAINNSDLTIMHYYQDLCKKVYPDLDWKILNTLKSSGVYKLVPVNGTYGVITKLVEFYRDHLYDGIDKVVPHGILYSTNEVRQAFWDGLYEADGDKNKYTRIDQKSQISAAYIYVLAKLLGYNVSINTRFDKNEIYRLTMTKLMSRKPPTAIKKMLEIPYTGYVYDLTTDNHHFAMGVGSIIGHNTDSIFAIFPNKKIIDGHEVKLTGKEAITTSINHAIEASKNFKVHLKAPHDLEYEKTFWPFILFSKKRYCANKYEMDDVKYKMNSMGIALKRRDNAPIVKHIYGGVLDIILNKQDIKASIKFMRDNLLELIDGKFPLESLVITKSLRADYKDPEKIAHKVLAERMGERDPGNKPRVNDRIPFVYIDTPATKIKQLQGDRIEHPDFIRKNSLKPDYEFYITNQIMKPVLQLYALTLENLEGYNKGPHYFSNMEKKLLIEKGDAKKAKERLDDLKEAEVQKILFDPVLSKIRNKRMGLREITDFFKKN
jgi:DNA polymerase elongation subunit (family B)